ncbi:MAG TPA: class I SAM-dependent methyltransferase [Candidatus Hypogeohydataceae bacterium YC41]
MSERLKTVYAFYSTFYDSIFGRLYAAGRRAAIRLMNIRPGEEILEVGVGTGTALPLYPREANVVGIDLSKEMLEKARQRQRDFGLSRVTLYEMDATKMGFTSGRFHKVIAAHTVAVVPEPLRLILEMKRVCRTGGEIYILNYAGSTKGWLSQIEKFISPFRNALGLGQHIDIESLLKEAELRIEHQERVNFLGSCSLIKCKK